MNCKKIANWSFIAFIFVFTGCKKDTVYSKFEKGFKENRWYKSDVKTHTITITEEGEYNIYIDFRHIYDFQVEEIPVVVNFSKADGTPERIERFMLAIKDSSGDIGNCMGDICDLRVLYQERYSLQPGEYTLVLAHDFNHDFIPNVMGVGVHITLQE